MDKIKVLYIDDEQDNLMAFNSSFRRIFDVYIADSAVKGIELLKTNNIEILIADQRMPDMTGVEFFESILDDYPNPIRILLTGYSDINAVKDAINKGQVYRYLNKPWNEYELKVTIENAYLVYQLKEQNNKLKNKYQKVFSESQDAIMIFDEQARLIDYNKAALKLFNTTKPQLNLTLLTDLVPNIIEGDYILNTLMNNEKGIVNYESKLRFNGVEKTCLMSASKISDNYAESFTFQAIIRDITKNVELEQRMVKTSLSAQETERSRISKDLHDGVSQSLVAIKFQLEQLKTNATYAQLELIKNTSTLLASAIQQLRRICFDILPPALSDYGLKKAIEHLCSNVSVNTLKVSCSFNNELPVLIKDTEISIYRIIQEFIQNSIKHANCTYIDIDFDSKGNEIILTLKDNGNGFDIAQLKHIGGISNMKTRVKSFNGTFDLKSSKKEGTQVSIKIPLNNPNQKIIPLKNNTEILTSTANIFLRDDIIYTRYLDVKEQTIEKKHIIENVNAISSLSDNTSYPNIIILSNNYINSDAVDYLRKKLFTQNACAIIYEGFLQEKIAQFLTEDKDNNHFIKSFKHENEALIWVEQQNQNKSIF